MVTVESALLDDLKKGADDYRRKDIFEFRPFNANRVEITRNGQTVVFERVKGQGENAPDTWKRVSPTAGDVDRDKSDSLLSKLSNIRAASFVDSTAKTGLDKPALTVSVKFDDGKKEERVTFGQAAATSTSRAPASRARRRSTRPISTTRSSRSMSYRNRTVLTAIVVALAADRLRDDDARPSPASPTLPPLPALARDIDAILAQPALQHGYWGVVVKSLANDETLYALNPRKLMLPASNMKIVTLAAAAEKLGWEFRYETTLLAGWSGRGRDAPGRPRRRRDRRSEPGRRGRDGRPRVRRMGRRC